MNLDLSTVKTVADELTSSKLVPSGVMIAADSVLMVDEHCGKAKSGAGVDNKFEAIVGRIFKGTGSGTFNESWRFLFCVAQTPFCPNKFLISISEINKGKLNTGMCKSNPLKS